MRYFINTQTNQIRQVGNSTPSVLNECLTATYQVGTEMVEIDGQQVEQPKLELVWKEITEQEYLSLTAEPQYEEPKPTYEQLVVDKIRAKYSLEQELAIQRQRDTKPQEFAEYNDYCEQCKADAKKEIGNAL